MMIAVIVCLGPATNLVALIGLPHRRQAFACHHLAPPAAPNAFVAAGVICRLCAVPV
jgi:hypothetical protein